MCKLTRANSCSEEAALSYIQRMKNIGSLQHPQVLFDPLSSRGATSLVAWLRLLLLLVPLLYASSSAASAIAGASDHEGATSGGRARSTATWAGTSAATSSSSSGEGEVAAIMVFGDSLLDPGNNNRLISLAKADRLPYGRDFTDHRPTGRFCNGPLSCDYVAALAGLSFPAAYLNASDNDILQGANFASAAAGILNDTGNILGTHFNFEEQIAFFGQLKQRWIAAMGEGEAMRRLSKSLFATFLGNNDYLINYYGYTFWNPRPAKSLYTPDAFTQLLLSLYQDRLQDLYSMGARKFVVISLPPVACIPFELLTRRSRHGECDAQINAQVRNFNAGLLQIVKNLQQSLPTGQFVYVNSYDLTFNAINNPTAYGFKYGRQACCGSGPYGGIPCFKNLSSVCSNASEYVFWDFAHPTSAFNKIFADSVWDGGPSVVYPFNIRQLASL